MDSNTAAKVFAIALVLQGILFILAPVHQARLYGWNDKVKDRVLLYQWVESFGVLLLATGIVPACMLFFNTILTTAVGISTILYFISALRLLRNDNESTGITKGRLMFALTSLSITCYAGFASPDWAMLYFKLASILFSLRAIQHVVFAGSGRHGSWAALFSQRNNGIGPFLERTGALMFLEGRIQLYCLACGMSVPRAMAFGALAGLAWCLSCVVTAAKVAVGKPAEHVYIGLLVFYSFMIPAMFLDP